VVWENGFLKGVEYVLVSGVVLSLEVRLRERVGWFGVETEPEIMLTVLELGMSALGSMSSASSSIISGTNTFGVPKNCRYKSTTRSGRGRWSLVLECPSSLSMSLNTVTILRAIAAVKMLEN
jgi:hypothetical protein